MSLANIRIDGAKFQEEIISSTKSKINCLQIIKYVVCAAFITFTAFYASKTILRYDNGIIAINTYKEYFDKTKYPVVTICSPFKNASFSDRINSLIEEGNGNLTFSFDLMKENVFEAQEFVKTGRQFKELKAEAIPKDLLSGRCVSYDTDVDTPGGETDSLGVGIMIPPKIFEAECVTERQKEACKMRFPVFFHERDSFIYNTGHNFFAASLEFGDVGLGTFVVLQKELVEKLPTKNDPCEVFGTIYSWKKCLWEKIDHMNGCHNPINDWNPERLPICIISQMLHAHKGLANYMRYMDEDQLVKLSGCLKPCKYTRFNAERAKYFFPLPENDTKDMLLTVYYGNTYIVHSEEYEAFGIFNLIGELGGLLGLFLGWSIYPMICEALDWISAAKIIKVRQKSESEDVE